MNCEVLGNQSLVRKWWFFSRILAGTEQYPAWLTKKRWHPSLCGVQNPICYWSSEAGNLIGPSGQLWSAQGLCPLQFPSRWWTQMIFSWATSVLWMQILFLIWVVNWGNLEQAGLPPGSRPNSETFSRESAAGAWLPCVGGCTLDAAFPPGALAGPVFCSLCLVMHVLASVCPGFKPSFFF